MPTTTTAAGDDDWHFLGEWLEQALKSLSDRDAIEIAVLKLEGYSDEEIAQLVKCTVATVVRKLKRIKSELLEWEAKEQSPPPQDDVHDDDPLVQLLRGLEAGDPVSQQQFYDLLAGQIRQYIASRLTAAESKVAGAEDITQSVFKSVMLRAQAHEFEWVQRSNQLWGLLYTIALRKLQNHWRNHRTEKRGGGRVLGEGDLQGNQNSDSSQNMGFANLAASGPSPGSVVIRNEDREVRLNALKDPELKRIAELKFEGYTNSEIAATLDRSLATIERKVSRIKQIWREQGLPDQFDSPPRPDAR